MRDAESQNLPHVDLLSRAYAQNSFFGITP